MAKIIRPATPATTTVVNTRPVRGMVATSTVSAPDGWGVRYHATMVAWFHRCGGATLRTGGFYTLTTARRMNQALEAAGLTWRVSRSKGEYVLTHRHELGVTVHKFDTEIRIG